MEPTPSRGTNPAHRQIMNLTRRRPHRYRVIPQVVHKPDFPTVKTRNGIVLDVTIVGVLEDTTETVMEAVLESLPEASLLALPAPSSIYGAGFYLDNELFPLSHLDGTGGEPIVLAPVQLTSAQLNAAIARALGWKWFWPRSYWLAPHGETGRTPPDYCQNLETALPLITRVKTVTYVQCLARWSYFMVHQRTAWF